MRKNKEYWFKRFLFVFWPVGTLVIMSFTPVSNHCVITEKIHNAVIGLEIKSNKVLGIEPNPKDAYKGAEHYSVKK